jgi:DNA-binding response OmpR family regulator
MVKLLIVEDNLMIADLLSDLLELNGYAVCGIARTIDAAVALCQSQQPDYAIVDLRLADDHLGCELAGRLERPAAMGILFASDNASGISLTIAHGTGFISKPFRPDDLLRALAIVIEVHGSGGSALSHPAGFRLLDVIADG